MSSPSSRAGPADSSVEKPCLYAWCNRCQTRFMAYPTDGTYMISDQTAHRANKEIAQEVASLWILSYETLQPINGQVVYLNFIEGGENVAIIQKCEEGFHAEHCEAMTPLKAQSEASRISNIWNQSMVALWKTGEDPNFYSTSFARPSSTRSFACDPMALLRSKKSSA